MTTDILHRAIDWHLRLATADEAVWAEFVAWLEVDPAHAAAYDELCLSDAAARDALQPMPRPANDTAPGRRWRPVLFGGGAVAACAIVVALALHPLGVTRPGGGAVIVAGDTPRGLTVGSNVHITLAARGTRLRFDSSDPRLATLEAGTARFVVRHDPTHPFRLDLGGHSLVDVGTVFTVDNNASTIVIGVSEGAVRFDPDRADVTVGAGRQLVYDRTADTATLSDRASTTVASPGSLSFVDAPFGEVTAAIGRATGGRITIDPALSGRRFTGVIRLTGSAARDVPHFADVTGTTSTRDGDQWRIGPAGGASR